MLFVNTALLNHLFSRRTISRYSDTFNHIFFVGFKSNITFCGDPSNFTCHPITDFITIFQFNFYAILLGF